MARYDEEGRFEIPDPRPVAVPAGMRRPLTIQEEIKRAIRAEMSQVAADQGFETFEEADDFEVDEDPELSSPYELVEAAPEWPGGVKDVDADPPGKPDASRKAQDDPGSSESAPTTPDPSEPGKTRPTGPMAVEGAVERPL